MSLADLDDVINALLAGSAEQRKKMADMERRIRELEKKSKGNSK